MRPGRALLAAALAAASVVTSVPGGAPAATAGPTITSQPVLYSARDTAITVTASALCETPCQARLYYRIPVEADTRDLGGTGAVSWTNVAMEQSAVTPLGTIALYSFSQEIPRSFVDVRGVDYLIRVNEGSVLSYWPGTPAAPGLAQPRGLRLAWWHVYVTNPATIHHVPALTAKPGEDIPIDARATCAKQCTARLWFRRTGLLNPSMVDMDYPPADDGASAPDEQWTSLNMTVDSIDQRPEQYGAAVYTFTGKIPASHVDTRGVDYALQVGDNSTRMFWPGTPYNGYYYAFDGLRTGWQHVYVQHPVIAHHTQSQFLSGRGQAIGLTAQLLCSVPQCGMTLQFNYGGGPLTSIAMTPAFNTPLQGGLRLETYSVSIPPSAVRTGTLAYRFLGTDHHTNAYAPGTFYNGYYIKLTGTPLGAYVILVT